MSLPERVLHVWQATQRSETIFIIIFEATVNRDLRYGKTKTDYTKYLTVLLLEMIK